jgi:AbrB family looped-hinge helix DNA binding protein
LAPFGGLSIVHGRALRDRAQFLTIGKDGAMTTAKLTTKGQITLPKSVRNVLGVDTGDRVSFRVRDDGVVELSADHVDLMSLRGIIKPKVRGVTLEDMQRAVEDGAIDDSATHK